MTMSKLVLKVCIGKWNSASRDKRELSACRELGLRTLVLAGGDPGDHGRPDTVDGFEVLRYTTRPLGENASTKLNRGLSILQWAHAIRKLHPDIISAHDVAALYIAWLSTLFQPRSKRPALIYDSHEFEIGRNTGGARKAMAARIIKFGEGFLMKRSAFSIVVNDSIADALQQIHHLQQRPVVVRSTPERWTRNEKTIAAVRSRMLAEMPGVQYLLMFHGNLGRGNGIPDIIRAAARFPDAGLVLMGAQNDPPFVEELKALADQCGLQGRVIFWPPVPIETLVNYVGAVDLELMPIEPIVQSHYYVLPNKFFESVQAEVPIIASDLPEMQRLLDQYHIGLSCKPNDVDGLCRCIETMRSDPAFYERCRENLRAAKQELCWEKEKTVLQQAYRALL